MELEPALKLSENPEFLQNQLITYIGNKRALLDFIGTGLSQVQARLGKKQLTCLDLFAGSGIVSRYLKQYASAITVNDLEEYSGIINRCYLSNKKEIDFVFISKSLSYKLSIASIRENKYNKNFFLLKAAALQSNPCQGFRI